MCAVGDRDAGCLTALKEVVFCRDGNPEERGKEKCEFRGTFSLKGQMQDLKEKANIWKGFHLQNFC
ncbi:hypothetical protein DC3_16190 [Deinococcus cellulosilyticus NBRC 106333 = KACC 11606]|uniref:Uncharacterized protein n=1 Tax=Deinococcus cellulosilyticus (strain DSM 18568 / NBRC 106333 / KACC 11606 / 5516J-15) TaxID=1223518 RepID=A0A511MZG1_DEIC1|nr:hypothetical protein DC3_16190 [Deinococcus cellulosilyticus NBRC 106333 = KACC 11606]